MSCGACARWREVANHDDDRGNKERDGHREPHQTAGSSLIVNWREPEDSRRLQVGRIEDGLGEDHVSRDGAARDHA